MTIPGTRSAGRALCVDIQTADGLKQIRLPLRFDHAAQEYLVAAAEEHTSLALETTLPQGVTRRVVAGRVWLHAADWLELRTAVETLARMAIERVSRSLEPQRGFYIASRASIPARAAEWKRLRDVDGWHIIASWIDEAGEGETDDFSELWVRIETEIKASERLILYVEKGDFPLKGAYIEVGIALAAGVPIFVVAPGVTIEPRSRRPLGSWMDHPLVKLAGSMDEALEGAARRDPQDRMSDVVNQVFDKIDAMPADEFAAKLATYQNGPIARAFTGMTAAHSNGEHPHA